MREKWYAMIINAAQDRIVSRGVFLSESAAQRWVKANKTHTETAVITNENPFTKK